MPKICIQNQNEDLQSDNRTEHEYQDYLVQVKTLNEMKNSLKDALVRP